MATLRWMAQRLITHYASGKFRDLVVAMIVWLTTMECSFQLLTGTMMPTLVDTVQPAMEVVDGGIRTAIVQS